MTVASNYDSDLEKAEKLYVYSGWLYEHSDDEISSLMSDTGFDSLAVYLKINYGETSDWFKSKVTQGMLQAGTAAGIKLTKREEKIARQFSK